jgi:hypothetical protein
MYSYEQGQQRNGANGRIGAQAMGPDDTYICQTTTDKSVFWADRNKMELGACFKPAAARKHGEVPRRPVAEVCPTLTMVLVHSIFSSAHASTSVHKHF